VRRVRRERGAVMIYVVAASFLLGTFALVSLETAARYASRMALQNAASASAMSAAGMRAHVFNSIAANNHLQTNSMALVLYLHVISGALTYHETQWPAHVVGRTIHPPHQQSRYSPFRPVTRAGSYFSRNTHPARCADRDPATTPQLRSLRPRELFLRWVETRMGSALPNCTGYYRADEAWNRLYAYMGPLRRPASPADPETLNNPMQPATPLSNAVTALAYQIRRWGQFSATTHALVDRVTRQVGRDASAVAATGTSLLPLSENLGQRVTGQPALVATGRNATMFLCGALSGFDAAREPGRSVVMDALLEDPLFDRLSGSTAADVRAYARARALPTFVSSKTLSLAVGLIRNAAKAYCALLPEQSVLVINGVGSNRTLHCAATTWFTFTLDCLALSAAAGVGSVILRTHEYRADFSDTISLWQMFQDFLNGAPMVPVALSFDPTQGSQRTILDAKTWIGPAIHALPYTGLVSEGWLSSVSVTYRAGGQLRQPLLRSVFPGGTSMLAAGVAQTVSGAQRFTDFFATWEQAPATLSEFPALINAARATVVNHMQNELGVSSSERGWVTAALTRLAARTDQDAWVAQ